MLVLLFAAIRAPHPRDMDSSAPPGGALWYCIRRGHLLSPLIRLCSASPTDAQLELDYRKVSLSFRRQWLKCHICWMPDVETTARHWAHARGTLDPFLQTFFFSSFDHAGFGGTAKGHIHSVEALSCRQRSPSCLSAQEALLFSLSLSGVSHSHRKPENSTFLGLFWGVYCCFSNPHPDTHTHTQQEAFYRLMAWVKLSWNLLPSLRSKGQTESRSPAPSNPPTHKREDGVQSPKKMACMYFIQAVFFISNFFIPAMHFYWCIPIIYCKVYKRIAADVSAI